VCEPTKFAYPVFFCRLNFQNGRDQPVLGGFENFLSFETNPIYAILQEPIYCEEIASNWSAERVRSEYPEFEITRDKPLFFAGEMVYPWMFVEYKYLRPLKEATGILAKHDSWPRLYDKSVLQSNTVPCAAVIYYNDMYVERTLSEEAAKNIRGVKLWVTSEYEHDGLRVDGEKVLGHLLSIFTEKPDNAAPNFDKDSNSRQSKENLANSFPSRTHDSKNQGLGKK